MLTRTNMAAVGWVDEIAPTRDPITGTFIGCPQMQAERSREHLSSKTALSKNNKSVEDRLMLHKKTVEEDKRERSRNRKSVSKKMAMEICKQIMGRKNRKLLLERESTPIAKNRTCGD